MALKSVEGVCGGAALMAVVVKGAFNWLYGVNH